jgi:arylsulfatase A-like enzyme
MVESMDMGIGKVLDKLKDLQLEENTLVIFTYDHGGRHLVDSGPLFHGFSTLWEGGIRVPLIMRWPAQFKRGVLVEQPAIAMDLTATMLDAAGRGGRLSDLDGMSLIPLVDDSSEIRQRTFFWSFGSMKAVREGKWKYVVDDQTQLLFDLSDDVSERHDVYAAHPDIVKKLRGALNDWEAAVSSD